MGDVEHQAIEVIMELEGVVHNGVVVPDDSAALPDGARVRIIVADRPSALPFDEWQRRFDAWLSSQAAIDVVVDHERDAIYEGRGQ